MCNEHRDTDGGDGVSSAFFCQYQVNSVALVAFVLGKELDLAKPRATGLFKMEMTKKKGGG